MKGDAERGFERLRAEMLQRRAEPFLLTVTAERRPHCGIVAVDWETGGRRLMVSPPPSHWDTAEAADLSQVTVLWPPSEPGGYSLIVDGAATVAAATVPALAVAIRRAVLHRRGAATATAADPATTAPAGDTSCRADCIPIL